MRKIEFRKNNYRLLLVCALLVSLAFNVYTFIMNDRYKEIIGKEAYKRVEDVRHRNESVLTILNKSIESGSIGHEDLLVLYKSYNSISDSLIELWSDYGTKDQKEVVSTKTQRLAVQYGNNDVYLRIENLVFEYLNTEMKNGSQKLTMDKDTKGNFNRMKSMAEDVNKFYDEFDNENLKGLDGEEKKKKVLKKQYWIDMVDGINTVIENHADYGFSQGNI